jgi:hypothetical protein
MQRTTIQLDGPLKQQLKDFAHAQNLSLKQVINQLLRKGLQATSESNRKSSPSFRWHVSPAKPIDSFDPADRKSYWDLIQRKFK